MLKAERTFDISPYCLQFTPMLNQNTNVNWTFFCHMLFPMPFIYIINSYVYVYLMVYRLSKLSEKDHKDSISPCSNSLSSSPISGQ